MSCPHALLLLACAVLSPSAHAQPKKSSLAPEFVEERASKGSDSSYLDQHKKTRQKMDEEQFAQTDLIQSARRIYAQFSNRLRVPGFISAAPLPQLARVVGPVRLEKSFRVGDTVYLRWAGAPSPKVGDSFATYTPAIVTQSLLDPTEFSVLPTQEPHESLPKDNRMAGYFYEVTGRVRIFRIRGGLIEGMVEQLKGQLAVGDELMQETPKLKDVKPISGGIQLSAAVVCGSPYDRLSTTKKSFIYINRGSRDGIRVGRIFESIENVMLDQSVGGASPQLSNGEAMVVHTTDSYSTAIITKQFDVIRIGSLLRTKQDSVPITPVTPFEGYQEQNAAMQLQDKIPEVPNLDDAPESVDPSLPEPSKAPTKEKEEEQLSELDALEKSMQAKSLTPAEKSRLGKLSKQEKLKSETREEVEEDDAGLPAQPTVENSFREGKKSTKKDKKAKKRAKNDEEELNQLMMEN
jgi:hypothetical protein